MSKTLKIGANRNELAPILFTRDQHDVSRRDMSSAALKVLYRLHEAGYSAYLVGGCIRDLMLGLKPKDFDVATNATPEEVRKLFKNSRMIGRRFVIVHIMFGREIIEVTTFRSPPSKRDIDSAGRIRSDNNYGTLSTDAARRDFSCNALYYNIADFSIVDYFRGVEAIDEGYLDLIGDPVLRYQEDPVRALRAVRFSAKLDFDLGPDTEEALDAARDCIGQIPPARLYEEAIKLFLSGYGEASFDALLDFDLLFSLFPSADKRIADGDEVFENLLRETLRNTDKRIAEGRTVQPGFLFAAMLWPEVRERANGLIEQGNKAVPAMITAAEQALLEQSKVTACPKRFTQPAIDVWVLQARMLLAGDKRVDRIVEHPKFRAAVDFLRLRDLVGDEHRINLAHWQALADEIPPSPVLNDCARKPRNPRNRRGPKKP